MMITYETNQKPKHQPETDFESKSKPWSEPSWSISINIHPKDKQTMILF